MPFAVLHLTLLALMCAASLPTHANPTEAEINLRQKQWGDGAHFSLAGQWDFFWQTLVSPDAGQTPLQAQMQAPVPGAWTAVQDTHGPLPGHGFGSYRVRLLVPEDIEHFYLYLPDMASAYTLWSNGEKVSSRGRVGRSKHQELPAYGPATIELQAQNGSIDLILQTSNYHYQWGGIWYPPKLTDESGLFAMRDLPTISAVAFSTLLIGSGFLSLSLFAFRRQDRKLLFFSLLCFVMGVRRLLIEERLLYGLDWLDWHTLQSLENLSIYVALPLLLGYLQHLFPQEFHRRLTQLGLVFCLPFCLAAITMDVDQYTRLNVPFQILAIALMPYIFYRYGLALRHRRKGARMFGLSLLVFTLAVVNDILNYSYLIDTPNMIHIGTLAFVLFQLGSMVNRYLQNFRTIEQMSAALQESNRELKQLDTFKDEFLAATSHELRTPLHSINHLVRLVQSQPGHTFSAEQLQALRLIEATSERLENLVNDILDAASIKHGKLRLQLEAVQLGPLVTSVVQSLRPLLSDKSVKLKVEMPPELPEIHADAQRVQQVLVNLIGNAIKFTAQGQIRVNAHLEDQMLNVSVTDTGLGISADHIERIFLPFEHYLAANADGLQSTGLGLPICRKLVELQNGTLNLSSVPGRGTQVEIRLPLASAAQIQDPAQATGTDMDISAESALAKPDALAQIPPGTLTSLARRITDNTAESNHDRETIYYVDDEAINRQLVASLLKEHGYGIETFADAASLLAQVAKKLPDVVLLDLMMPGIDGMSACQKLRARYHQAELPIMMLTARHQTADITQALQAGANDYLVKPYEGEELLARLESQLSIRRLWQARAENRALRDELSYQAQLEQRLTDINHQLQHALDTSSEALLILDASHAIVFANESACKLLDSPTTALTGEMLNEFMDDDSASDFADWLDAPEQQMAPVQLKLAAQDCFVSLHPQNDDSGMTILILQPEAPEVQEDLPQSLLDRLADELSQSRHKIDQIETVLTSLQPATTQATAPRQASQAVSHQELIVQTMRSCLSAWERHTHLSKVDLAEKSRCWSVYLDGTSAKTRTLDKYLSTKTLPSKPRWRSVLNTAKFVLDHCELPQSEEAEILALIQQVDQAFS